MTVQHGPLFKDLDPHQIQHMFLDLPNPLSHHSFSGYEDGIEENSQPVTHETHSDYVHEHGD